MHFSAESENAKTELEIERNHALLTTNDQHHISNWTDIRSENDRRVTNPQCSDHESDT
jgi:hypothetical protein